jgi:hypothetical protein
VTSATNAPPTKKLELADIVRLYEADLCAAYPVSSEQKAVLHAIKVCRTASLGGHIQYCKGCDYEHPVYNPCRNRHCPKCQCTAANLWIEKRSSRLLQTHYFHVVFTLPEELRTLARFAPAVVYSLLMTCAAETLQELARDHLGATLGITEVLHTWTRKLSYHPHVHCIVTGGGLSLTENKWIAVKDEKFLFPDKVVGALFRGKMLAALNNAYDKAKFAGFDAFEDPQGFDLLMQRLPRKYWYTYLKPVFTGVKAVLDYLGRYTHRVGISNGRLLSLIDGQVTFKTKNGGTATLPGREFLRRFTLHVLPKGFVKIRHYGILASQNVNTKFAAAAKLLPFVTPTPTETPVPVEEEDEDDPWMYDETGELLAGGKCPRCGALLYMKTATGDKVTMPVPLPQTRGPP